MSLYKKILLLTLLIIAAILDPLYSSELSRVYSRYENEETSEQLLIKKQILTYQSNRRDIFWPYDQAANAAIDFGFTFLNADFEKDEMKFDETMFSLAFGKKFSPFLSIDFSLGTHVLDSPFVDSDSVIFIESNLKYQNRFNFHLSLSKDFFRQYEILPNESSPLTSTSIELNLSARFDSMFYSSIRGKYTSISDSNSEKSLALSGGYEIEKDLFLFNIGLAAEYRDFKYDAYDYHSPLQEIGFGPELELSVSLYDKLYFGASSSISRNKLQVDGSYSTTHYSTLSLVYGERDEANGSLEYVINDLIDGSPDSQWYSKKMSFSLNFFF